MTKSQKTQIEIDFENNIKRMENLIERQVFSVKDANNFLTNYYTLLSRLKSLEKSRDKWKERALNKGY